MQLIDTHCHIQDASLELQGDNPLRAMWLRAERPDPDDMIAHAARQGVATMICVGTTVADSAAAVQFVQNRPRCWASIGLHPHEAKAGESEYEKLADLVPSEPASQKIVAIGECGLDYFYNHSDKKDQEKALRFQVELAVASNLPVIFHVRDAFDDFWPIFDSYPNLRGVLHSFTDSRVNLDKALERGLYIGVNGIMTFTKQAAQLDVAKNIPLSRLLLETDAPFLTPVPFRGKVNEPAYVAYVANFLADLRKESLEELADATTAHALQLFSIS